MALNVRQYSVVGNVISIPCAANMNAEVPRGAANPANARHARLDAPGSAQLLIILADRARHSGQDNEAIVLIEAAYALYDRSISA